MTVRSKRNSWPSMGISTKLSSGQDSSKGLVVMAASTGGGRIAIDLALKSTSLLPLLKFPNLAILGGNWRWHRGGLGAA